ncbi:MAG: hypothetical protein C0403_00110 [Desulfobacterium sp.]|nr:hypothetical protein [Desulfobacterium sp.]
MNTIDLTHFKQICNKVRDSIPSPYTSSWDEDFQVIRIVFHKTEKEPLLQTLMKEFPHQWDFTSIDTASDFIDNFINSIFGIIPGQILFTSSETTAPILFAVWWPWGNEDYISLRVGIYPNEEPYFSKKEIQNKLSDWFNL